MARIDVISEIAGKVWKISAEPGTELEEDDDVLILESMKMEIPVPAPAAGKLVELLVSEGDDVAEGQAVAVIEG